MMEVKKATILVASIKRRKKKTNEEGRKIMSLPNKSHTLTKAFSGSFSFSLDFIFSKSQTTAFSYIQIVYSRILGVDEKSMMEILVKWHPEDLTTFRNENSSIFLKDKYFLFERWQDYHIAFLVKEFLRFQDVVVQWTMHPWERDAPYGLLIELACTRSSDELLGARKAYQSLYSESIEEDVASRVEGIERQLLVALVSTYRYEGSRINDVAVRAEAIKLGITINRHGDKKKLFKDEEIVRILATRSKPHLKAVFKCYKETFNKNIEEDLDETSLKDTIYCLYAPSMYFSKILDSAMKANANEDEKEALTRVIVTRANVDIKEIAEKYNKQYGTPLTKKIEDVALGNYKDFLVTLVQRAG
ncbi:hypothetical protein AAG906_001008 [Vitis piasezkii]